MLSFCIKVGLTVIGIGLALILFGTIAKEEHLKNFGFGLILIVIGLTVLTQFIALCVAFKVFGTAVAFVLFVALLVILID